MMAGPPDSDATAGSATVIRRLLADASAKSRDLSISLHPAWVQRGLRRIGLDPSIAASRPQRWSAALAALYGLHWPGLDRFVAPAHRIALLPRDELRRVLAAVALHAERQRVRLCIGRDARAALLQRLGTPAYEQLLQAPPLKAGAAGPLSAAELDADRLVATGIARLVAGRQWHDERLLRWLRLAIAPDHANALPRAPAGADLQDLLTRLPSCFPEHAWLFGSITDRALSASMTA
jgi:Bacterial type III secretion protein (HrpB4)